MHLPHAQKNNSNPMAFDRIPLTGLDHFFLALEKHNERLNTVGSTCRYFFELDGVFTVGELKSLLCQHPLSARLSGVRLKKRSVVSGSFWEVGDQSEIAIHEIVSGEQIPQKVLEYTIDSNANAPYFCFFLIQRPNGRTTVVFVWHHLLMDGYGAVLYMKSLNEGSTEIFFKGKKKEKVAFSDARDAKKFVSKTSRPELTTVFSGEVNPDTVPAVRIIDFSEESSEKIRLNSVQNGAKFGQSTFFLAACGIAVRKMLLTRGGKVDNFWVPVPQDQRKKMAKGPVLSNHLSLLFYRLEKSKMKGGLRQLTTDLTAQMKNQIKYRTPDKYNSLMHYLRVVPKRVYYRFIKGPHGGAISSFLFTVAPEHPDELSQLFGRKVVDAMNLPPLTFPPGLTFAFAKFQTKTRIFVLYSKDALSESEVDNLEDTLKVLLEKGE